MARRSALALLVLLLAQPAGAAGDPLRPRQWGLERVGASEAWAASRGGGAVIAVVDTGVDLRHEDLRDRLVAGWDFVDGDARPQDEHGHGTHVAGIAAATGGNGRGVAGVAPRASIMPVRVLDEDGSGSARAVARGIRWAADHGAGVVNLSLGDLGQPLFGPAFADALEYAWSRGAVPVVASGNSFLLSSGYEDHPAVVVSATDRRDRKPAYSSGVGEARWGMAAPGGSGDATAAREDDVLSTYWVDGRRNSYAYLAGTSMAAPHVAGAAALLRSLGLTPRETVDRLLSTARDVGPPGRDSTFGRGRLDAAAAVAGLGGGTRGGGGSGDGASGGRRSGPAGGDADGPEEEARPRRGGSERPPRAAAAPSPRGGEGDAPGPGPTAARGGQAPADRGGGGVPVAPVVVGFLVAGGAVALAWVLFRPGPSDPPPG